MLIPRLFFKMGENKMIKNNEQMTAETQKAIDKMLDLVTTSIDGVEKLTHVQLETSRKILEETSQAIKGFATVTDPKELMARVNQIATSAVEKNIASATDVYNVVKDIQAKMSKVAEESVQSMQQAALNSVEGASQFNPTGSNFASDAIKSWINSTNQTLSAINKVASQVAEFTNNNIKAATSATVNAAKKAGSK